MNENPLDYFEPEKPKKYKDFTPWVNRVKKANRYVFPVYILILEIWQVFFDASNANESKLMTFIAVLGIYVVFCILIGLVVWVSFLLVSIIWNIATGIKIEEWEDLVINDINVIFFFTNILVLIVMTYLNTI